MKTRSKSNFNIFTLAALLVSLLGSAVFALPVQTVAAAASNISSLSADDWAQVKALLPALLIPNAQQAYIKASNTETGDSFGSAVSFSGDTLVVGVVGEDSAAVGVNGDQTNNLALNSGAAYVFVRIGGVWSQQAYLKASNTEAGDQFGSSVSIDGDTLVIGAVGESSNATGVNGNQADNSAGWSGAAYVFTRTGTTWSQQAYLKASATKAGDDSFGKVVSLSGDTLVVGAPNEDNNAIGVNGSGTDSAPYAGAAYVFTRSGTTWSQQAYLKASNTQANDLFGTAVSASGDTIVVGAPCEASNATGVNGNQADNSALYSGAVYVFTRSTGIWSQQAYLKASNTGASDYFGSGISLSGDTLVIGAQGEGSNATGVNGNQADNSALYSGAVYVFTRSTGAWSQQAYLKASNTGAGDRFGTAVSVSDNMLVVGAYQEASNATSVNGNQADNSASWSGAGYVFTRTGAIWSQQVYLKAFNTESDDVFGWTVSVSGDTVVIGASNEDSNASGVNGNQADNSASGSGAVYVFADSSPSVSMTSTAANSTNLSPIAVSVTFSEDVFNFISSDITTANGTVSNFAGGGTSYTFDLTPIANGLVTANIAAGVAQDGAGNDNTVGVQFSRTYDSIAPIVASFIANSTTASFNIPITAFNASDAAGVTGYMITTSATAPVAGKAGWSGTIPTAYTVVSNGTYTLYPWAKDAAGNVSSVFGSPVNVIVDTTAPTVLSSLRANTNPTSASNVDFTVIFSEFVTGVNISDFILTTTSDITGASINSVSGSGTTYTVNVHTGTTNNSGSGLININTATLEELVLLPGIGPTTAQKIIDYRAAHGPFATIDDLDNVPGIGPVTIDQIRLLVTVSISGASTLRLDVVDDDSIVDGANNKLGGSGLGNGNFISGQSYIKISVFTDVPFGYWANSYIERLANAGITGGCGTGIYCPDSSVTRAQMAVFILKGMHGSSFTPPAINGSTGFTDVPVDYWAATWIKQLAAEGITGGCGTGVYCPDATVTRAQMAVFLLKAKHGSSYSPPTATGVFTDVPTNYWAASWIEQLATEGVTSGCGTGTYCPDDSVTRAQMAVFLVKAFNLP